MLQVLILAHINVKSSPGERILDFTVNILCTKFIVHYFSRYSTTVIRFEEFFFRSFFWKKWKVGKKRCFSIWWATRKRQYLCWRDKCICLSTCIYERLCRVISWGVLFLHGLQRNSPSSYQDWHKAQNGKGKIHQFLREKALGRAGRK